MTLSTIFLRNPKALSVPGYRGGPAPYASRIMSFIHLGAHARLNLSRTANENFELTPWWDWA